MCDDELFVLDACVVIDFCGRTDNLDLLLRFVDGKGVITTVVQGELERQRKKRFPRLADFAQQLDSGVIRVVDPPVGDPDADRIIATWDGIFGPGEVSCVALCIARRWVFVSRDREPMREFAQRETIMIKSTQDVLDALVRTRFMTKAKAATVYGDIMRACRRR